MSPSWLKKKEIYIADKPHLDFVVNKFKFKIKIIS